MRVDVLEPATVAAARLMVQPRGSLQSAPLTAGALHEHVALAPPVRTHAAAFFEHTELRFDAVGGFLRGAGKAHHARTAKAGVPSQRLEQAAARSAVGGLERHRLHGAPNAVCAKAVQDALHHCTEFSRLIAACASPFVR